MKKKSWVLVWVSFPKCVDFGMGFGFHTQMFWVLMYALQNNKIKYYKKECQNFNLFLKPYIKKK